MIHAHVLRRGVAVSGAAAAAAAILLPGVAADASSARSVKLTDFKVTPSAKSVGHGKVKFVVANKAAIEHELIVIKTSKKASELPVSGGRASEKGSVGEVELAGHKTKSLTLSLKKGHYALICNVKGHYKGGMYTDLTVS
ncbi:MAG TPA: sulfocyanin-like copper-binding protein [Baekduia sp.]|jgi:uncharacterized cupredoxin-like copper-binding protein|nr:sulfocyanin-like copper-binding protein [Baekduia sp.]